MKQFLAIVLLIIGAVAVSAQTNDAGAIAKVPCGLTLAQVPVINGLRLGMTPEQALGLFPGSSEDAEVRSKLSEPASKFGETNFTIRPEKYKSKEKFAGISQIAFNLLDGRIYNFSVSYNGPEWPHVDKFVAKFVEGTTLPAVDAWDAYVGLDTQLKLLKCTDFEIRVFAGGEGGKLNYVLMKDLSAEQKLKDRRVKAREKARQESKPKP